MGLLNFGSKKIIPLFKLLLLVNMMTGSEMLLGAITLVFSMILLLLVLKTKSLKFGERITHRKKSGHVKSIP
jgi:hypothetical protein